MARVWPLFAIIVLFFATLAPPAEAQDDCGADTCPVEAEARPAGEGASEKLLFFWGLGCPHCEEAEPFMLELEKRGVAVDRVEVRRDEAGRRRFLEEVERLHIEAAGVPTFIYGDAYVVGFRVGTTESQIEAMLTNDAGKTIDEPLGLVDLPLLGRIDPRAISLPVFTVAVGLVDGINPCAMWVLLVLLGILLHVKERRRIALYGGAFVIVSGVVYFLFMTAWINIFSLVGLSRAFTIGLGVAVVVMGLINLKEVVWFKKGVSLVIPERAKPGLYRRMRAIARSASVPTALAGIVALAFVVNLIELACTLGLPAIYTRILSLRADLTPAARYAYLLLYNVAYVVPLAVIVAVFALTFRRTALSERGAKILKAVSGVVLVSFGLLFIFAPGLLT